MVKMETLSYYICKECQRNSNTYEYQFEYKEGLEENDWGTDELDSSINNKSLDMADEIDDRVVFLVGRTTRFGRAIKLPNKKVQ